MTEFWYFIHKNSFGIGWIIIVVILAVLLGFLAWTTENNKNDFSNADRFVQTCLESEHYTVEQCIALWKPSQ